MRTCLHPTETGRVRTTIIPKRVGLTVPGLPSGILGAVTSAHAGLTQAAGVPDIGTPGAAGVGEKTGLWPLGIHNLVPDVALGNDHVLPVPLHEGMRTVPMMHLTAVSGQHATIIPGLGLETLGTLPRW